MIFLDTNAVIWLYQGNLSIFPEELQAVLERADLFVSPLVKLELQYLHEVGRIHVKPAKILHELHDDISLGVHGVPLVALIEASLEESWTRDPFDRLIVAHAKLQKADLVTKDETILRHYPRARWD